MARRMVRSLMRRGEGRRVVLRGRKGVVWMVALGISN